MPRIVVIGTGTGVGKTFVSLALARAIARSGRPVLALKPVETGVLARPRGGANRSDAAQLQASSNLPAPRLHPLYGFRHPVSPHLAARREHRRISLTRTLRWINRAEYATLHDTTLWSIVETAGGALSPLGPRATNADLALHLDPSIWILVAPDSLGVLHDVTATLAALRSLARAPDLVVLSQARRADPSTGSNAAELARLGIARPVATFRRGARNDVEAASVLRAVHSTIARKRR